MSQPLPTRSSDRAYPAYVDGVGGGLTKREYFAALALAAHRANPAYAQQSGDTIAQWSVNLADALIASLNSKQEGGAA